jgi:hypothetical protein
MASCGVQTADGLSRNLAPILQRFTGRKIQLLSAYIFSLQKDAIIIGGTFSIIGNLSSSSSFLSTTVVV